MKKLFSIAFAGAMMAGMMLAGCGKGSKDSASDSDTVITEETVAPTSSEETTVWYLTRDSIAGVKIGMEMQEIPDSIDGLYDRLVNGASRDAVTVEFADSLGNSSFVAYDFGEHKVDVLNLITDKVKVKAPRGDFSLGDSFFKVLELPGVRAEWAGYDDTGMWYWTWEGLWFAPSQENLNDLLTHRLYNSNATPTQTDFDDRVTIGFIGTGLPF